MTMAADVLDGALVVRAHGEPSTEMSLNVAECHSKTGKSLPNLPPRDGSGALGRPARVALTERQLTAIALLIAGQSSPVVARRIGVDRRTVMRWRLENPIFIAELRRRQQDMYATLADRMRVLAGKAIRLVEHELTRKRNAFEMADHAGKYALGVLRATGAMRTLVPCGSDVVDAIVDEQVRNARGDQDAHDDAVTESDRQAVLRPWMENSEGDDVIESEIVEKPLENADFDVASMREKRGREGTSGCGRLRA